MKSMHDEFMTKCLFMLFLSPVFACPQDVVWDAQSIHWQQQNADGSKYTVLEGHREQAGIFSYAFFLPDGVWVRPHFHSADARVLVVKGTLLLGEGRRLLKDSAKPIRSGSFFLIPRHAIHWEGAKGDTLIIGVVKGPWKTTSLGN